MDFPTPYQLLIAAEDLLASYASGQRIFQWADLAGGNLAQAMLADVDLTDANLVEADLIHASLNGATLAGANLSRANLSFANLTGANLRGAILSGAKLRGAKLTRTVLDFALLDGADLSDASLEEASLRDVSFEQVNAWGVRFGATRFLNTRLGSLCESACVQMSPSFIDLQTLVRSRHDAGLDGFMRRAGIAAAAAARLALVARNVSDADAFESSSPVLLVCHAADEPSVVKLRDALDQRRLTTYIRPWHPSTLGLCRSSRVVLVCSESALRTRAALRGLPLPRARDEVPPFFVVTLDRHLRQAVGRLTVSGRAPAEQLLWAALQSRIVADLSMDPSSLEFALELDKLVRALVAPT
jgi:hypothetical protein